MARLCRYLSKLDTFTDFLDVAAHLKAEGYTSTDQLAIQGRSAGGLLVGAALNLGRGAELCACVVAGVPFVDVLVGMCDPSIPLVSAEWEEWGNPNSAAFYAYMAAYSPVDNVVPLPYPAMLVTAGLHDPRVPYWEPAKWVQRLREGRTNDAPLLLQVDLAAGHFSASDRYAHLQQTALEHAFVLDTLGRLSDADRAG